MKFTPFTSGLIIAGVNLAVFLALYFAGPKVFASGWLLLLVFILQMILLVIFGVQARKQQGNIMSYGKAFSFLVTTCLIFTVINITTSVLLFQVIDPEFMEQVKEISLDNQAMMYESMGLDPDAVSHQMEKAEAELDKSQTFGGILKSSVIGFILWIVVSALGALIVKKNRPEFA